MRLHASALAAFATLALLATPFGKPALADHDGWHHGLTLLGELKYDESFKHYDYVNPDAPKGGQLDQVAIGTYDSFNPFVVRGSPAAGLTRTGGFLYDTLMDQAPDQPGTSYGLIAEAARYPADFSSVTVRLDPKARFHDGEPIKPEDVIWSFETLKENHPFWNAYYASVTRAEETGEGEVTFRFSETGNRELPNIMGDLPVLPKHWWTAEGRDVSQPTLTPPVGSGPYRIAEFQPGRSITWERAEDYWGADNPTRVGRYNYDRIKYNYFRDDTATWEAFKKGGLYDIRVENRAQRWAEGYDFPAFQRGDVVKGTFTSTSNEPMQAFVLNTRRDKFEDRRVREALNLAFDFESMNRTLFFDLYERTDSYFEGGELAAEGLPSEAELAFLAPLRGTIPEEVFTKEFELAKHETPRDTRKHLRQALRLLKEAGWESRGGRLVNAETGEPFTIEFLAADPSSERVIGPYANQLKKLGIQATTRVVDVAQYQSRVDKFDFDIITDVFMQSQSPGNEQRDFWGSAAADLPGSQNTPGIKDPAVDALIDNIIFAKDREELVAATKALDRVLLWNFYVVPQWHNPEIWIGYRNKFGIPETQPDYAGVDTFSWWIKDAGQRADATR